MMSINMKALLSRMNGPATRALEAAAGACLARTHYEVTVEHVLAQFLDGANTDIDFIFSRFGLDKSIWKRAVEQVIERLRSGNSGKPVFSPRFLQWVQEAWLMASIDLGETTIRTGAFLLALLINPDQLADPELADILQTLPREDLKTHWGNILQKSIERPSTSPAHAKEAAPGQGSALEKYCTDFTRKAADNQLDPVFGRDREIYQIVDILTRRRKNNPILVGEAGVGKTAVVEGLALRVIKGDVPHALQDVAILGLDMGLLQAGAGMQGEFERRLKSVIEECKASPKPLILFIDEAHTLIGAGGSAGGSDAANLLKPALARGELRTIAATTWSEYKKYFEKDPALARRFQPVKLEEPTVAEAILILRGLKNRRTSKKTILSSRPM